MEKSLKVVKGTIVAVLVFVSALLILSKFDTPLRFRVFSVKSGSMEPAILTGSVVVVLPNDTYQVGDIVTMAVEGRGFGNVTHRVVQVFEDPDNGIVRYETKGDANEDPDAELVDARRVVGKVAFSLPFVGYLISFIQTQIGLIVLLIIPATLLVYSELANIKKEAESLVRKRKESKEIQDDKEKKKEREE